VKLIEGRVVLVRTDDVDIRGVFLLQVSLHSHHWRSRTYVYKDALGEKRVLTEVSRRLS
jgi:hypothetical protein